MDFQGALNSEALREGLNDIVGELMVLFDEGGMSSAQVCLRQQILNYDKYPVVKMLNSQQSSWIHRL